MDMANVLKDFSLLLLGVYGIHFFQWIRKFIIRHENIFYFFCLVLFFIIIICIVHNV